MHALLLLFLAALQAVQPDPAVRLEQAVARFRAGDFAQAAALLEPLATESPDDRDVALLLGIALVRSGRAAEAMRPLAVAAASPDAETAASAHLFLGLAAAELGDTEEARVRFAEVAASPSIELAAGARRLLAPAAPLSAYLLVRPEIDSNVPLLPGAFGVDPSSEAADAALLLLGSLDGCLGADVRACLVDTLAYRRHARLRAYDSLVNLAGARLAARRGPSTLSLGYTFELARLGGDAFALGHLADAGWRQRLARGLWLQVDYRFLHRDYQIPDYAPLGGPAHNLSAGLRVRSGALFFEIAGVGLREDAETAALSATGGGARLAARARITGALSAGAGALLLGRRFDEGRRDAQLRADATLSLALDDRFGLVAGLELLANASNDPEQDLGKLTAYIGVEMALEGP